MTQLSFTKSYPEVDNIKTYVFAPGDMQWQAGQYLKYTLPQAGETEAENVRYFTIASAPSEGEVHITTRQTGSAFKAALDALRPGDTVEIEGPDGDFVWNNDDTVVLVAAGIGVTPMRSMLVERAALHRPLKTTLVYFGRDENVAFRDELDALAANSDLHVIYVVGEPVTADTIIAKAPQVTSTTTYLSGPEPMVETVGEELKSRGVDLKQDWFPGYSEQDF